MSFSPIFENIKGPLVETARNRAISTNAQSFFNLVPVSLSFNVISGTLALEFEGELDHEDEDFDVLSITTMFGSEG